MSFESGQGNNKEETLIEAIKLGIISGYEKRFAEAPARAREARKRADEALDSLREGLLQAGFPPESLDEGYGGHRDDLRLTLSWGAFDYSIERPDGSVQVPASEIIQVPLAFGLHQSGDIGLALQVLRQSVTAMRLYRQSPGQRPISDPDLDFATDFASTSEIELPSSPTDDDHRS